MKIIDAHLHMRRHANFDRLCEEAGHHNQFDSILSDMRALGIAGCVVMGSNGSYDDPTQPGLFDLGGTVDLARYNYPSGIAFCIGVSPEGLTPDCREGTLAGYRRAAACPGCVGFKIYLGYNPVYADDPIYHPVYELARELDLAVVFHTGDTAHSAGRLRFSHPLTVDEVAVRYPDLRLVLAHFGNPWVLDAAEVAKKNPNVWIDLSGLAVGIPDREDFCRRYQGYVGQLTAWLGYLDRYDRVLYGTDWPLVNMKAYLELIRSLIPEDAWPLVFYDNACQVFPKLGAMVQDGGLLRA